MELADCSTMRWRSNERRRVVADTSAFTIHSETESDEPVWRWYKVAAIAAAAVNAVRPPAPNRETSHEAVESPLIRSGTSSNNQGSGATERVSNRLSVRDSSSRVAQATKALMRCIG